MVNSAKKTTSGEFYIMDKKKSESANNNTRK